MNQESVDTGHACLPTAACADEAVPGNGALLGYRHPDYALSLAAHGSPRHLARSDGWVIERAIPDSPLRDAMGPYPLFGCRDWQALPADIDTLREDGLVSLVLVSDPLLDERERAVFGRFDVVRPFKTHYLAELDRPPEQTVSRHHRYYARKAARQVEVAVAEQPLAHLDEWAALYAQLVARHAIGDLRAFSRDAFARQLGMPGAILFRALSGGRLVGGQLVLMQGEVAHAHLAAFTDEGYRQGASYVLDWTALEYLRGRARYLNWGGGTGSGDTDESGLVRYKLGWSSQQRATYLLGAVLDPVEYARLVAGRDDEPAYFPAYRHGEFG